MNYSFTNQKREITLLVSGGKVLVLMLIICKCSRSTVYFKVFQMTGRPFTPRELTDTTKYDTRGRYTSASFPNLNVEESWRELLASSANAGLAQSTWSAYKTGIKMFEACCVELNIQRSFPLTDKTVLAFVGWMVSRKLAASTMNTYLASLRHLHMINGNSLEILRTPLVNLILEGRKHLDAIKGRNSCQNERLPVTPTILKLLKKLLKKSDLEKSDKAMVWTVCSPAFAGAMRIHELLAKWETTYDPNFTLLGRDLNLVEVQVEEETIEVLQIRIKCEKKDRVGCDTIVDVYQSNGELCPIRAYKKWAKTSQDLEKDKPAFRDKTGRPFTGKRLNLLLKQLLEPHFDYKQGKISGHSFRSGLPSMMNNLGYTKEQIQAVGRWSSRAYQIYTKLPRSSQLAMAKDLANSKL